MPMRNAGLTVGAAIRSLQHQTFSDWYLIAVDDGSSDDTVDVVQGVNDRRIVVVEASGAGISAALNQAAEIATAPLLARMDADDESLPHRLEMQIAAMEARPAISVLGCAAFRVDDFGALLGVDSPPTSSRFIARELFIRNPLIHGAIVMRHSFFASLGGYQSIFPHAEDYDLWIRGFLAGHQYENLAEALYQYRVGAASTTGLHGGHQFNSASDLKELLWAQGNPPALRTQLLGRKTPSGAPFTLGAFAWPRTKRTFEDALHLSVKRFHWPAASRS